MQLFEQTKAEYARRLEVLVQTKLSGERAKIAESLLGIFKNSKNRTLTTADTQVGNYLVENAWPRNAEDILFCAVIERLVDTSAEVSFRRNPEDAPFSEYVNLLPSLRDQHFENLTVSTKDAATILIPLLQRIPLSSIVSAESKVRGLSSKKSTQR